MRTDATDRFRVRVRESTNWELMATKRVLVRESTNGELMQRIGLAVGSPLIGRVSVS